MSFRVNNKLTLIYSFQVLNCSLDSLIKNLIKDDFMYLSQEFGSNVLDVIKQKGFYPYEYTSNFENFKKKICVAKKSFIVC